MKGYSIDINCDLGEGIGNDELLMPFLSSCNIACGAHAGDQKTMSKTIKMAIGNGVKIGAHPGFEDKENFGRKEIDLPSKKISELVFNQIQLLNSIIDRIELKENEIAIEQTLPERKKIKLNHVKPHGALYNMAAKNDKIAKGVIDAIINFNRFTLLYVPYNSVIAQLAIKEQIPIKYEGFLDRNYNDDLSLVSRKQENSVLYKPEEILENLVRMVKEKKVKTINGNYIHFESETFCIHGDNSKAVQILKFLHNNLSNQNINID